jgi:phasin family protein
MTPSANQTPAFSKAVSLDFFGVANHVLVGLERLVTLNLSTTKAGMADLADHLKAMLSVRSADELVATTVRIQQLIEMAVAYGSAVAEIVNDSRVGLAQATEARLTDLQAQAAIQLEEVLKFAPTGSEAVVTTIKSVVHTGQQALEAAMVSSRQVVDVVDANFANAVDAVIPPSQVEVAAG